MRAGRLTLAAGTLLLALGLATMTYYAARLHLERRDNGFIAALMAGQDIATSAQDPAPLIFARLAFLTRRDRLEEAQPLANQLIHNEDRRLAAAALYTIGNARLRLAIEHLGVNRIDPATPLVRLAKQNYRDALVIQPDFWDAKFNLDIAMRLVRDFPQLDMDGEEIPPEAAKKLWTDLPGIPKGLP
ncbi:hypothetical protein AncyloWKF20_06000 [Ancylobacter sp. WKF20]|uniref:hypothetical protein n=1 Tax=Ancylobacter sp. WKF20 TaxID=3039801 RepID=UPI0024344C1C|nr:hypothetical protein [Ancylobacter sp. WKF20]WGD31377.1 hypothetical protein AncyloWKF20_06000 [Ancylobacter sp. WKF20]